MVRDRCYDEGMARHVMAERFQAAAADVDDGESKAEESRGLQKLGMVLGFKYARKRGPRSYSSNRPNLANNPNEPGNGSSPAAPRKECSLADALISVW